MRNEPGDLALGWAEQVQACILCRGRCRTVVQRARLHAPHCRYPAAGTVQPSWLRLSGASMRARNAMAKDYAVTTSAADTLGSSKDSLAAALNGLVAFVHSVEGETSLPSVRAVAELSESIQSFDDDTGDGPRQAMDDCQCVRCVGQGGRQADGRSAGAGCLCGALGCGGMSSGSLYTRMRSGSFVQTRMMLLVR